ncbi:MAG: polysaccharide deacetylase family protein [Chitinophagia bacterium]|nr:polysaccharide deacetylase family protein [Chitinophagia bacterium]
MRNYWVKTPGWLKNLFHPELIWNMPPGDTPTIYLTFDDGPHPTITPFVLHLLEQYHAHATFFCVGNNVRQYPDTYQQIWDHGHVAGNHTYSHINGWKTETDDYLANILEAGKYINTRIFRPPYGRIKLSEVRALYANYRGWKIYMWDVLSGDFDHTLTAAQCAENATRQLEPGSIVVFHDSEKAWARLEGALPLFLDFCRDKKWKVASLPY